MKRTTHSYFVCMQDTGRHGLEANVQPEITRREVVSRLVTGEYRDVAFIHHVDGLFVEDLTIEIMAEAEAERGFVAQAMSDVTRTEAGIDRVADYRKHERA